MKVSFSGIHALELSGLLSGVAYQIAINFTPLKEPDKLENDIGLKKEGTNPERYLPLVMPKATDESSEQEIDLTRFCALYGIAAGAKLGDRIKELSAVLNAAQVPRGSPLSSPRFRHLSSTSADDPTIEIRTQPIGKPRSRSFHEPRKAAADNCQPLVFSVYRTTSHAELKSPKVSPKSKNQTEEQSSMNCSM